MTLGNILSQMGIGNKQLTERLSPTDYGSHDTHTFYAYEAPTHTHHYQIAAPKHHYGGGHKSNAAMSALTLLAFLFFLHILQQCLRDHMAAMTTSTPIVIMTAGREGEEAIAKLADKLDKSGITDKAKQNTVTDIFENKENYQSKTNFDGNSMTKISVAEHTPKIGAEKYSTVMKNYGNHSFAMSGFVRAMDLE